METFWFYFKLGFDHVLDPGGLDHFYFLIALTLPFMFREWQKLLIWVSIFTLGHTLSLFASNFKWILVDGKWVEFFIPITIGITCISVLFKQRKNVGYAQNLHSAISKMEANYIFVIDGDVYLTAISKDGMEIFAYGNAVIFDEERIQ